MFFDHQPVLTGEQVSLRPLRFDDHDALYAVASDPLIWEQHPVKTRHEAPGFHDFFEEAMESGGALIATETATRRVIGSSRFHGFSQERSEVEIGWTFLARSHWGGRTNGEMKQLMLDHAFQFVDHVVLLIDPNNLRSRRAAQKVGGVHVGSRPNGGDRDSLVYRVSAPTTPGV